MREDMFDLTVVGQPPAQRARSDPLPAHFGQTMFVEPPVGPDDEFDPASVGLQLDGQSRTDRYACHPASISHLAAQGGQTPTDRTDPRVFNPNA